MSQCPGNRRGHTWSEPRPDQLPGTPRQAILALRICSRCQALGRVNSQGVVVAIPSQTAKPPSFTMTTLVSPSPRELVEQLSSEERVAIDLILERSYDRQPRSGEEPPNFDADPHFGKLVPNKERRGYLITLSRQLRALGVTLHDRNTAGSP